MNSVFFKNIDRSEALEEYINNKTCNIHGIENSRWIIGKENKTFKIKALVLGKAFESSDLDPVIAVNEIIKKMKVKLSRVA